MLKGCKFMENYKATVVKESKELSAKERIAVKDFGKAIKIDEVVGPDDGLVIDVDYSCIVHVDNGYSENKSYDVFVLVDKGGNKYVSSSKHLADAYFNIVDEMQGSDEEYQINIYKLESKNYKGKYFLTCEIV